MRNKKLIIIFSILLALTLIILLCSMLFSIKKIGAYCYNGNDEQLNERIVAEVDSLKGRSIFVIDEDSVKESIEAKFSDVQVINIERKFPNRVTINYKRTIYYEVQSGGKYYSCRDDGQITAIGDVPANVGERIEIKSKVVGGGYKIGDKLLADDDAKIINDIVGVIERSNKFATAVIEFIDLDRRDDMIYVKMRTGIYIKIIGKDNIEDKFHLGLSVYDAPEFDKENGKMIIVSNEDSAAVGENDYN